MPFDSEGKYISPNLGNPFPPNSFQYACRSYANELIHWVEQEVNRQIRNDENVIPLAGDSIIGKKLCENRYLQEALRDLIEMAGLYGGYWKDKPKDGANKIKAATNIISWIEDSDMRTYAIGKLAGANREVLYKILTNHNEIADKMAKTPTDEGRAKLIEALANGAEIIHPPSHSEAVEQGRESTPELAQVINF